MMTENTAEQKIILIADPNVLSVRIQDNHDSFIDLLEQTVIAFGPSPEIPNNTDYTKMRSSVYDKLVEAQKMLPRGMKLCLYEAYRSLGLQERLFSDRFSIVKTANPLLSHEELFLETLKLASPVVNLDGSYNIPPHSTGGAVDVYLIDDNGDILDMGILAADWMQDLDSSLSLTFSRKISNTAQKNRQIMSDVLNAVGFVNYPYEYWHWSYGDKYWAYHKQEPYALYGSV